MWILKQIKEVRSMSYIMVDIEADGPIPGDYSMIAFGAVLVGDNLDKTFYGKLKPMSDRFVPEALAVSGFSREETLRFPEPVETLKRFESWVQGVCQGKSIMVSDCSFDWMFMCWYFHHFLGHCPFGYWQENLESLYKGIERDMSAEFNHLRKTAHTHDPLDDAKGNAEALMAIKEQYGLKIAL
jgi:DNA polymerase III epsilon subunit-like protein